jgi:hypothetical protein
VFDTVFKKSPLQRSGYTGLRRNIEFVNGTSSVQSRRDNGGRQIDQSTDQPIVQ